MIDRRALLLGLVASAAGCASGPLPLPAPIPPRPLTLRPVVGLAPAGGLSWMITARPAELLRDARARAALHQIATPARLDQLAAHLGLDVRSADHLVHARYGEASLTLLDAPHDQRAAVARFTERLSSAPARVVDDPRIDWISGKIGAEPRAFADLEGQIALFEAGPPLPLRAALGFARGKLKRARPALDAPPLDALAPLLASAPVAVYLPRRAAEAWADGKHALLDEADAVGIGLSPAPGGARLEVIVTGDFSGHVEPAQARLAAIVERVAGSPLGHLLGLDAPEAPDEASATTAALRLARTVSWERLGDGLRAAVVSELPELFGPKR
ncbi:MAG: hypothetical protein IT374_14845 [Polyangiaceae bacterium]|nr:hypothetical protein [Polyangiaceae bacterium]